MNQLNLVFRGGFGSFSVMVLKINGTTPHLYSTNIKKNYGGHICGFGHLLLFLSAPELRAAVFWVKMSSETC